MMNSITFWELGCSPSRHLMELLTVKSTCMAQPGLYPSPW